MQWVPTLTGVCQDNACWGAQGAYRISGGLFAFYLVMAAVVVVYRPAHLGAWFIKLLLFLGLVACTIPIPAWFWDGYSVFARYASIIFLFLQIVVLIDFAYAFHEYLMKKADEKDAQLERDGWEPGIFSNCWKVSYVLISFLLFGASIASIGVMYAYISNCSLTNFFLSETLILGVVLILVSLLNAVGKGLLPPIVLFAYNTYLCYGAITNNPDLTCNSFAAGNAQNTAAIISGIVIAVISVTYAAYSTTASLSYSAVMNEHESEKAIQQQKQQSAEVAEVLATGDAQAAVAKRKSTVNPVADVEVGGAKDWPSGASKHAISYGANSSRNKDGSDEEHDDDPIPDNQRPYIFHLVMASAGIYLAMVTTNWGTASSAAAAATGNLELSTESMWVRIASQWVIYIIYIWSLLAPICFPNRDFS
jgi:serine incorporator 1/3